MSDKLTDTPLYYNGYNLLFYKTKYFDDSLAIVCETTEGEPYAKVSLNLSDYGYNIEENEIFLNHKLSRDFKELFCEKFCYNDLNNNEKIYFGPYNTVTEKLLLEKNFYNKYKKIRKSNGFKNY